MPRISNADAIRHWSAVPRAFAEEFGDQGDVARQHLLTPALLQLLGDVEGKAILDAGCGQGYLARLLAKRGAQVTGIEPATPFMHYAVEREQVEPLGIRYIQTDLTTFSDSTQVFDIVVANMVLMDIPDYHAALDACFTHLRPGGEFVCSLTHPCFEESDSDYHAKGYVAVREYFEEYAIPQRWGYRFHRPLSHYLNALIQRGGSLQAAIEPRLDAVQAGTAGERNLHVPGFIVFHVMKGHNNLR
jgi:SAM-dependent methyltransferase